MGTSVAPRFSSTTASYSILRGAPRSSSSSKYSAISLSTNRCRKESLSIRCQGWFEFNSDNSDLSTSSKSQLNVGDFKILSHLKDLGCGDLKSKPKTVHFRGCINESYIVDCTTGKFFVKVNRSFATKDMFAGELEGLQKMSTSEGVRVPFPLGSGDLPDGGSYIIMEHLQFRPFGMMQDKSQETLGHTLAALHQVDVGESFGFPLTTRLGILPLENAWKPSWASFFLQNRLKERLMRVYSVLGENAMELQSKEERLFERVTDILKTHTCKPSILHGDLWIGNTGLLSTGEVALFDPACCFGDAEFDLAFRGWAPVPDFPGFSDVFYTAYHKVLPAEPGFEDRRKAYQLFHLLNHLLIYGLEYYKHVLAMVDSLV